MKDIMQKIIIETLSGEMATLNIPFREYKKPWGTSCEPAKSMRVILSQCKTWVVADSYSESLFLPEYTRK